MNATISEPTWGYQMNDSIYTLSFPPCPPWAKSFVQQNWNKLGIVVWNNGIQQIAHLFGSQTMCILEESRESKVWRKRTGCWRHGLSDHNAGG